MSVPLDTRALTDPADRAAVRAHRQQLRQSGRQPRAAATLKVVLWIVGGAVFLLIFVPMFVSIAASLLLAAASSHTGWLSALFVIVPVFILLVFVVVIVTTTVRALGRAGSATRSWRLDRFAQANGLTWYPSAPNPPLPGMIFALGGDREATDIVRGVEPRFTEVGNYRYTTGSGEEKTTYRWGYVAMKLRTPLPNIVLDATSNNALFGSNLPASFARAQRLSLEGHFDRHFTLYCPAGYERDALYLFTPDIMARFIDHAAALDVEIVDDWVFLYGKRDFATLDPATWAWLYGAIDALADKFAQWERWRDDRLTTDAASPSPAAANGATATADALPFAAPAAMLTPPPGVAAPGRRLKRGAPVATVVAMVLVAAFWLLAQSGIIDRLVTGH